MIYFKILILHRYPGSLQNKNSTLHNVTGGNMNTPADKGCLNWNSFFSCSHTIGGLKKKVIQFKIRCTIWSLLTIKSEVVWGNSLTSSHSLQYISPHKYTKKACKMQSNLLITQFSRNKHLGMEIMTTKHAVSLKHMSLGKSNHFGIRISEIPM